MKRFIPLLLAALLLMLSLASCAPKKPAVDELLWEGYNPDAVDDEPYYHAGDTLYIYMPRGYSAYKQEAFDQVNAILRREGFNMEFVHTDCVPLHLSMYYDGEIFEDFVIENISEGEGGIYLPPWETIWELEKDNLLGDFLSLGMVYAPNYTRRLSAPGEPEKLTYMTTYFQDYIPQTLSVLVRKDVALEYGKEIRTGSDYVALLEWLKARDPDSFPGMTLIDYMTTTPYDLFLPEEGYIWQNPSLSYVFELENCRPTAFFDLPAVRKAMEDFVGLRRDGLLFFRNQQISNSLDKSATKYDDFPTVLLDLNAFTNTAAYAADNTGLYDFDATGYHMFALYNNTLPGFDYSSWSAGISNSTAVAGVDTDVTEFLRLMEWLNERENYNLLFYGTEDVDYVLKDGRMSFIEDSGRDWKGIRELLKAFERYEFRPIPLLAPYNVENEIEAWRWAYDVRLREDDAEAIVQWHGSLIEKEYTPLRALYDDYSSISFSFFMNIFTPDEDKVKKAIDDYYKKWDAQNVRELVMEEIALLEKIYDNAVISRD